MSGREAWIRGNGKFSVEVLGESHYQRALEEICDGRTEDDAEHRCEAELILDDGNPHDDQAVRVAIEGKTVGYLSRKRAREYRAELKRAGHPDLRARCDAVIRGGWDRGEDDQGDFGVWLDLPEK